MRKGGKIPVNPAGMGSLSAGLAGQPVLYRPDENAVVFLNSCYLLSLSKSLRCRVGPCQIQNARGHAGVCARTHTHTGTHARAHTHTGTRTRTHTLSGCARGHTLLYLCVSVCVFVRVYLMNASFAKGG